MTAFLLDTNTVSRIIRNDSDALRQRYTCHHPSLFSISVITEAELLYGLARKPDAIRLGERVRSFLERVQRLPWSSDVAAAYGDLRCKSEANGITCGALDLLIAAHAHATRKTLVTSDLNLHRLDSWLMVEDWTL